METFGLNAPLSGRERLAILKALLKGRSQVNYDCEEGWSDAPELLEDARTYRVTITVDIESNVTRIFKVAIDSDLQPKGDYVAYSIAPNGQLLCLSQIFQDRKDNVVFAREAGETNEKLSNASVDALLQETKASGVPSGWGKNVTKEDVVTPSL